METFPFETNGTHHTNTHCCCFLLAPAWEQMAVELQGLESTKDFKFAEVNCLLEGDVCDDNDVRGYPSLKL